MPQLCEREARYFRLSSAANKPSLDSERIGSK